MLELELAAHLGQRHRLRTVLDGRIDVEDAEHPFATGHGRLPGGKDHAQIQHRLKQTRGVAEERDDDAQSQRPADHGLPAEPQDNGRHQRAEQLQHRGKAGGQADGLDVGVPVGRVDGVKLLAHAVLFVERLDHPHGTDVLRQATDHDAVALARLAIGPARIAAKDHGGDDHHGQHR